MANNLKQTIKESVEQGKEYLLSKVANGLCPEFHQLKHGPSWAWTTACVGSTLWEFKVIVEEMIDVVLSLQDKNGGWSYNLKSAPDADSTLRVIQFLIKIGFRNKQTLMKAEKFVLLHQQPDGGFATYLPEMADTMGYPTANGWTSSHPCVTSLAINLIRDNKARRKARQFLEARLKAGDTRSYWWRTPLYILYETGRQGKIIPSQDPVEISLHLLLDAKNKIPDQIGVEKLCCLQQDNGSFPPSRQFQIPRPHQLLDELTGKEEIVEDRQGIFSTSAAIVALSRQGALI